MLFPGLSSLFIEEIVAAGPALRITARSAAISAPCPRCGTESRRVHAWHARRLTDLPVGGRPAAIDLRIRRLRCTDVKCPQRTFREQIPALAGRYSRRTLRLAAHDRARRDRSGRTSRRRPAGHARRDGLPVEPAARTDGATTTGRPDTAGAQRRRRRAAPRAPLHDDGD
ncbi:transposase family protein [Pseudonocardia sp. NPDC046786]|uniref:transposase family protein n=1 Tax=Pseudonocardia sp. NPDC046786 TaxID=3155471 RepID=UPI0033C228A8